MEVYFETRDFGGEAETQTAAAAGQTPALVDYIFGTVVLTDGDQRLSIGDDLAFLAVDLCGRAPHELEAKGLAEVRLLDTVNTFTLTADLDQVRVRGEPGENAVFPKDTLIDALRACGVRFAGFLDNLALSSPHFRDRAQYLRRHRPRHNNQQETSGEAVCRVGCLAEGDSGLHRGSRR